MRLPLPSHNTPFLCTFDLPRPAPPPANYTIVSLAAPKPPFSNTRLQRPSQPAIYNLSVELRVIKTSPYTTSTLPTLRPAN